MKKLLPFLLGSIMLVNNTAQTYVPTKDDVIRFYKTKTLVVLDPNPILEYNLVIKEVFQNEWKLTPYEFIPFKDFEEKRMNSDYSFVMLNQVRFERDESKTVFIFLSLLLGGSEKIESNMPDICALPVAYKDVDEDSYNYKLATLLRFMQQHVDLIYKDPTLISRNIFEIYNKNMSDIQDKTLYLLQTELAPNVNTEAKIKAVYPFKFKITTKKDIEEAINRSDPNVVFLHKVGPEETAFRSRCYKILIGAADSKFYYFDYHMIDAKKPDGFLITDFKKLAKTKKKK